MLPSSSVLAIPSLNSFLLLWFLVGLSSGVAVAIVAITGVISSRELRTGVTVVISEKLLEGLADRKETFLSNLQNELIRRGTLVRRPLEAGYDLIYRGFFNVTRIYILSEGPDLRYGFRISATNQAIALGVLLLIPFVIGAAVVFVVTLLRQISIKNNLHESAEVAASLTRRTPRESV